MPNLVESIQNVERVSCGTDFTIAIMQQENRQVVYSWGSNKYGQLGQDGGKKKFFLPTKIQEF
jgi:alpha-tubulin suppressor-like RCC1 family protein